MIKLRSICILLVGLQLAATAQTHVKFRKVIGTSGYDDGYSVQQTHDKGYVIGGATSSFGDGSTDMYAVKTDSMGIPRIQVTIGGINIDRGYSIKETTDHGFIFLGYTNSYGAGGYDFYLVKTDSMLDTQWTKTYGGSDWDFGSSVKPTSDGGYILCGSTFSYGHGGEDYYLIKTNSTGDTLWTKTYGGAGDDIANAVAQTTDGGYILTGYTKSMGDTLGDIYTIKTTSTGDTMWTAKYGLPGADFGNDVIQTMGGKYVVAGETSSYGSGGGAADGVVVQYSSSGTIQYTETEGLSGMYDSFNAVTQDTQGKIALAGVTKSFGANGDMFLIIADSSWNFFNGTTFGNHEFDGAYAIDHTMDNCFVLCGITNSFNNNLDDIYLVKTDTAGLANVPESVFITGVQDEASLQNNKFIVFPNPANDRVYLNINNGRLGDEYELLITDVLGKEVKHLRVSSAPSSVNTSDLADGMYYVILRNEEFSSSQKLIVHH